MEVAGQGEPPGDPWTNDPGPLITPVDAGSSKAPLDYQLDVTSIVWRLIPQNLPMGPPSRAEEQLPCVITRLQLCPKSLFTNAAQCFALLVHINRCQISLTNID